MLLPLLLTIFGAGAAPTPGAFTGDLSVAVQLTGAITAGPRLTGTINIYPE